MIPLEQLRDGTVTDRNFQKLMSLVMDTGGQSVGIRFGSDSVTWNGASPTSPATTVTHGLGSKPVCVLLTSTGSTNAVYSTATPTTTSMDITATTRDGSTPANGTQRFFYWAVIV